MLPLLFADPVCYTSESDTADNTFGPKKIAETTFDVQIAYAADKGLDSNSCPPDGELCPSCLQPDPIQFLTPKNCNDPSCTNARCDQKTALFLYDDQDELCTSCKSNCLAYYQVRRTGLSQILQLGPAFWLRMPIRDLNLAHDSDQPWAIVVHQGAYEEKREPLAAVRHQECYSCMLDITTGEDVPGMSDAEKQSYILRGGKLRRRWRCHSALSSSAVIRSVSLCVH
jgi:hypothetical protein